MRFQLNVWNVKLCVPVRSTWHQKVEKNIWTNRLKMGFFLKFLQGLNSVFRSKSMSVNYTLLDINKLNSEVICKLLPLLHQGITHKNKTSIFSKIIEISSCLLFTAIFGITLWATNFVLEINSHYFKKNLSRTFNCLEKCLIYQNIECLGQK